MTIRELLMQRTLRDKYNTICGLFNVEDAEQKQNLQNCLIYINELLVQVPIPTDYYLKIEYIKDGDYNDVYMMSKDKNDQIRYSLSSCLFEEFVNLEIDEETLQKYDTDTIIAEAIWEQTFMGWSDEEKQKELGYMHDSLEKAKKEFDDAPK